MRILRARVQHGGARRLSRGLVVLVDDVPDPAELRYRAYPVPDRPGAPATLYVAVDADGYVSRLLDDGSAAGFGGRPVTITMTDGTTRTLVGPWSTSSDLAARHVPAVHPITVVLHTDPRTFASPGNGSDATLTRTAVQHALRLARRAAPGAQPCTTA